MTPQCDDVENRVVVTPSRGRYVFVAVVVVLQGLFLLGTGNTSAREILAIVLLMTIGVWCLTRRVVLDEFGVQHSLWEVSRRFEWHDVKEVVVGRNGGKGTQTRVAGPTVIDRVVIDRYDLRSTNGRATEFALDQARAHDVSIRSYSLRDLKATSRHLACRVLDR